MPSLAFQETTLPNGSKIKNRIVKAAMEENLANVTAHNQPSQEILRLYDAWGKGGAGIILSGHVMIDPRAMASAADILLAEDAGEFDEALWRKWISQTQANGSQFWFQINHPGRQARGGLGFPVYAPSPIRVNIGAGSSMAFEAPLELTEAQIEDIIRRFAWTAAKAEELGAAGVEIHSAHGYLSSQFLSPRTNQRTDKWGGSIENRSRFLVEIIKAVKAKVSPSFGVSVKINSSDFQKGGFNPEDLEAVVKLLNPLGLDFLELSGGSYEIPAMMGAEVPDNEGRKADSTKQREAYFLIAAEQLEHIAEMPLLVTGGISRLSTVEKVSQISPDKVRLVGVGTAMGIMPDLPNRWMKGEDPQPHHTCNTWGLPKAVASISGLARTQYNMHRISQGKEASPGVWPSVALASFVLGDLPNTKAYKKWSQALPEKEVKA